MKQMSLVNHFLLPTEQMGDVRFFETVLYICRHTPEGAWGFIVNQPLVGLSVGGLLGESHIDGGAKSMTINAMKGGFVRMEAGFVLHTGLPRFESSMVVGENICLTTSRDILPFLVDNSIGHFMVLMGFCSWQKGQLEQDIARGDWLTCPADAYILFDDRADKKRQLIYQKLGLNPTHNVIVGSA